LRVESPKDDGSFPTEWEPNKVLVVLSPHEAVRRSPYVGVSGSETIAIDRAEAGE
jgi:hypothetical protein